MKKHAMIPVLAGLLALGGCGVLQDAGPQTTQQRTIGAVTAVKLLTSGDLRITTGESPTLSITAGANQLDDLTSVVDNGTLILDSNAGMTGGGDISYALVVPAISQLELRGSGDATGTGVVDGDFSLIVSGSGAANLTGLDVPSVAVNLSGSGDATLGGQADAQEVDLSGSGGYDGSGLTTGQTGVQVTGSGDAQVNVSGRLSATISGSGDISYTGSPTEVEKSVTGSGSVSGS